MASARNEVDKKKREEMRQGTPPRANKSPTRGRSPGSTPIRSPSSGSRTPIQGGGPRDLSKSEALHHPPIATIKSDICLRQPQRSWSAVDDSVRNRSSLSRGKSLTTMALEIYARDETNNEVHMADFLPKLLEAARREAREE